MSKEKATDGQPPLDGWGQPISEERLAELESAAEKQRAWAQQPKRERGESHLKGMKLTGAEVFWLTARAVAGPEGDIQAAAARLRDRDKMDNYARSLFELHLEGADLRGAHLERVDLRGARLERANLSYAQLEGADLRAADLEGANLSYAQLKKAVLFGVNLQRAGLQETQLEGGDLSLAQLQGAGLRGAHLKRADLRKVHLEGADLREVQLERADLREAHLEGANFGYAQLEGADLREATLDGKTSFVDAWVLHDEDPRSLGARLLRRPRYGPALGDLRWGDFDLVQLTQMQEWETLTRLADERDLGWGSHPYYYRTAVRAYRQVAQRLRDQGFSDIADRLTERAQNLQRKLIAAQIRDDVRRLRLWRLPSDITRYLGSAGLALLAGYGYRPFPPIMLYVVFITAFAAAYFAFGTHCPIGSPLDVATLAAQNTIGAHVCTVSPDKSLTWNEAFVISFTAFHGRGFFVGTFQPSDPQAGIAAAEAVLGLLIEISFIATFTQRFFGAK